MPKLTKSGDVTLEQIRNLLSSSLGSQYNLLLKGSKLEVVQDGLRGCVVKVKQRAKETDISFGPFVPSTGLAVVMSLVCVGGAIVLMLFVNIIVGAVLLPLTTLLRLLPSSGIVNEVKKALEQV